MAGIFKDTTLLIEYLREQALDLRELIITIKGKPYLGEKDFKLNVTESGIFYLNDKELTFITTNSNPGILLKFLVNPSYTATDQNLKKALHTDDMNVVYRE